jgi:hypothetical protein
VADTPRSRSLALDRGGDTGVSSARVGIDGALWNANQKLTLLLTMPQIILLLKRSSAAGQQQKD